MKETLFLRLLCKLVSAYLGFLLLGSVGCGHPLNAGNAKQEGGKHGGGMA